MEPSILDLPSDAFGIVCDYLDMKSLGRLSTTHSAIYEFISNIFLHRLADGSRCRELRTYEIIGLATRLGPALHCLDLSRADITIGDLRQIGEKCSNLRKIILDSSFLQINFNRSFDNGTFSKSFENRGDTAKVLTPPKHPRRTWVASSFYTKQLPKIAQFPERILQCISSVKEIVMRELQVPLIYTKESEEYLPLSVSSLEKLETDNLILKKTEKGFDVISKQVVLRRLSQIPEQIEKKDQRVESLLIHQIRIPVKEMGQILAAPQFSGLRKIEIPSSMKIDKKEYIELFNKYNQPIKHLVVHACDRANAEDEWEEDLFALEPLLTTKLFSGIEILELEYHSIGDGVLDILNRRVPKLKELRLLGERTITTEFFEKMSMDRTLLSHLEKLEIFFNDSWTYQLENAEEIICALSQKRPSLFLKIRGYPLRESGVIEFIGSLTGNNICPLHDESEAPPQKKVKL